MFIVNEAITSSHHSSCFHQVVSNCGVGVDHVDLKACDARGIPVGNTPDVLSGSTADCAFALMLACARRIVEVC